MGCTAFRHDTPLYRLPHPVKRRVDVPHQLASIRLAALDYQQVGVAVWSHLAPGGRAKENDPLGLSDIHNAPHDLVIA